MDLISEYSLMAGIILNDYQWLIAILFTAGLSLLIYFKILRINNFLSYSEKYQNNMKRGLLFEDLEFKDGGMFYKGTDTELEAEKEIDLIIWFNLISEVGLLFRKGLIDRDLTYKHFGNNVYELYTTHKSYVDFIENRMRTNNISFLFKEFRKKGARQDRIQKIRNKLGIN